MNERMRWTARSAWRLMGCLLLLGTLLSAHAEPPALKLPGRKPDSAEPWGAFLGRAAHFAIGGQYRVQHPSHLVFLDTVNLQDIVERARLGDRHRLSEFVRLLRPDITDASDLVLFEIKPDNEMSRRQGREQAGRYLKALNQVVALDKKLTGGTGFDGSLFIDFEKGGALWQLSWRTPEPGVTLYRWSYRRAKSPASWKERAAQADEALPDAEAEALGELAEQAIRAAYEGSDLPEGFRGHVYLPVECQ
ncbi:hypothetical protein [Archangium primigenium]|uniref:hypothetical protein n=1 Tax=[Archangium] primigenium TaxID=2792470 RepID=UPI0019573EC4|nr:hypothetical protein [Archangium primigenium]MBM7115355.1 hypothetical protein [Archangium primigenium]